MIERVSELPNMIGDDHSELECNISVASSKSYESLASHAGALHARSPGQKRAQAVLYVISILFYYTVS